MEERKGSWLQRQVFKKMSKTAESAKKLKRTKDFAENRKNMVDAFTSARPTYWLQGNDENFDALDRMETGMLEEMKSRSEMKTREFRAVGKGFISGLPRYKYSKGKLMESEVRRGTIAEQKAAHETRAMLSEAGLARRKEAAMRQYAEGEAGWAQQWRRGSTMGGKQVHEITARLKLETEAEKSRLHELEAHHELAEAVAHPELLRAIAERSVNSERYKGDLETTKSDTRTAIFARARAAHEEAQVAERLAAEYHSPEATAKLEEAKRLEGELAQLLVP